VTASKRGDSLFDASTGAMEGEGTPDVWSEQAAVQAWTDEAEGDTSVVREMMKRARKKRMEDGVMWMERR
jgi:hypothetical protein